MKRLFLLFLILPLCAGAAEMQWLLSYKEAQAIAKEKNLPMLVFMAKANCRASKYMQENALVDDGVVTYIKKYYVPVSVNIAHADVPEALKSKQAPVFHFVSPDGVKVHKTLMGSKMPAAFIRELRKGVRGFQKLQKTN